MAQDLNPDIRVIGGGAGGLAAAAAAIDAGASVALIEKSPMGGSSMRGNGSLTMQTLIAAAERLIPEPGHPSTAVQSPRNDSFLRAIAEISRVVGTATPNATRQRMTALGVRIVEGTARFRDRNSVAAGDTVVTARRFIIATGSSPRIPPIPGLDRFGFLTGESIAVLTEIPPHLIVIGAGAMGLELAQVFRRFGA